MTGIRLDSEEYAEARRVLLADFRARWRRWSSVYAVFHRHGGCSQARKTVGGHVTRYCPCGAVNDGAGWTGGRRFDWQHAAAFAVAALPGGLLAAGVALTEPRAPYWTFAAVGGLYGALAWGYVEDRVRRVLYWKANP